LHEVSQLTCTIVSQPTRTDKLTDATIADDAADSNSQAKPAPFIPATAQLEDLLKHPTASKYFETMEEKAGKQLTASQLQNLKNKAAKAKCSVG
jgi:hypothetical protein